jgi:ADP-heptose:LPS heptosyltransferase
MGWGDDLIFLGKAEEYYKKTGKKVRPVHGSGWSPFFDNVEFLSKTEGVTINARDTKAKSDVHIDYYVKDKEQTILGERLVFCKFKPSPFRIRLTEKEIKKADKEIDQLGLDEFCIINPDYKSTFFSENKNWGFKKYQELTNRLSEHIPVLRISPKGSGYNEPKLKNAINIEKKNIKDAVAIMRRAQFGVSYDGLLQHVFAGFNVPAVIIQGGLVDTSIMCYDIHTYHTYDHPLTPCGSTYNCAHCAEANAAITVDEIFESCLRIINENSNYSS